MAVVVTKPVPRSSASMSCGSDHPVPTGIMPSVASMICVILYPAGTVSSLRHRNESISFPQLADGVEAHAVTVPVQVLDHEHRQVDLGELVHERLDLLLVLDDIHRCLAQDAVGPSFNGVSSRDAGSASRRGR